MKSNNIVKLFGGDDPRIDKLVTSIHHAIDDNGRGVFQLATILGVLRTVEQDLIDEVKTYDR